ncbi:unnamed protein product [Meloidogyne enterolobii]|uniref:Uncharacterized protein n=1 Tax=Meloidogyne enterolobii TaxID=390850 RepID=A0ACB0Z5M0_MELEN
MSSFFYFLFISVSLLILANADDAGRYPSGDDLVQAFPTRLCDTCKLDGY